MTALRRACAALACLVVATTIANAAPGVAYTSKTQLNNNGDVFSISVFPGKARYTTSAALGSVSTAFGNGTVLDYFVATGVNNTNYTGTYLAKGGTYINNPSNGTSTCYTPSNYGQTWVTSDPDSAPYDYKTGTCLVVGQTTYPLIGTINISTLASGTLYVIAGSYSQSMVIDVNMTGPGQTQLNAVQQTISPGGSYNRFNVVRYDFDNSGGLYSTLTWKYNGGSNLSRAKFYGVVLSGTIYVDTTPPNWVSTWPQVNTLASTSFTVRGETNENGTGYYVVLPAGATAPTAAQVKAGTDASNAAALKSGSFALTAYAENTAPVTGLTPSTAYDVWFAAQDAAAVPNLQTSPSVVSVSTIAPDTTPPVWDSTWPQVDTLTPTSFTARAKTNKPGTAYYVVLASGAAAPSAAQVKAGTDASDASAIKSGSMTLPAANTEITASVTGLPPSTACDVWFVAQDAEAIPNLQASPVLVSVTLPSPVGQYATGTFAWGTDSVWATSSGGAYTHAWGPGNDAVIEGAAGTISVAASGVAVHNITFNANGCLIAGNTLTLSGATSPTLTLGSGISGTVTSAIAGTVGFTKSGLGSLSLSSPNTFSGGIILNGGTIAFGSGSSLNNNPITVTADTVCGMPSFSTSAGITLTSGVLSIGTNNGTFTTSGAVTGGGGITLSQLGGGATYLNFNSTANTFTGPIAFAVTAGGGLGVLTLNSLADSAAPGAGNIRFGAAGTGAISHIFNYGSAAIAALTLNNRQFELAGSHALSQINNNSSQAITINTDLLTTSGTGTQTLTLGGAGTGLNTFGGKITNGTITTLNLVKADSGTWVLDGANTYNGTTTVSAGTLLVNGDQSLATGAVAVNGGTLGGTGKIGGTVTVAAAGSVAPGVSVGTLSISGGLDISAQAGGTTGKLKFDLGPIGGSDKIAVTGTLTIGSGVLDFSDFVFTALTGLTSGTYKLITSGGISGTLAASNLSGSIGIGGTGTLRISNGGAGNDLELVISGLAGGNPYDGWSGGAAFDADSNNDGVTNGLAWMLGATDKNVDATGLLPKVSQDAGALAMTFDCLSAADRESELLNVQYGNDLGQLAPWTDALVPGDIGSSDVGSVHFEVTANGNLLHVVATIPSGEAPAGKLFGRLEAVSVP